jgi:hypothetical protein
MSQTRTAPWDYNRRPWLTEHDRAVAALPLEWRMRYHTIFLLQPHPPVISQYQAYLQTLAEMELARYDVDHEPVTNLVMEAF